MKVTLIENDGCFAINLVAENMEEAAKLVRFGMNRTDEIRSASTSVYGAGGFESHLVFGKHKRSDSSVPKRK